jgi:tetratricopeptide (TPR) repeat protein
MGVRRRALALAIALVAVPGCRPQPAPTPAPPTRYVLLVGLDAADWLAIDPLIAQGRLPHFAALRQRGRSSTMISTPPLLSPILWTTIATGQSPEEHGILDFMVDLPDGRQAPVAATSRRVPALWNLLSARQRSVGLVAWWATWPAESLRGIVVSDRVAPQLLRAGATLEPHSISPRTEEMRLGALRVPPSAITREELAAYVPTSEAEYAAARRALDDAAPGTLYRDRRAHLAAVLASERSYERMARAIVAAGQPDLVAVYYEGIDTVSHLFVREPSWPAALAAVYSEADGLLGRMAAACAPDTWVMVVSDHGFQSVGAGVEEDPSDLTGAAAAWHRPYGIAAAMRAGDLVRDAAPPASPGTAGPSAESLTPLDVAPTVLHALGEPVTTAMPGRVVQSLLPPQAAAQPVRRVAPPLVTTPGAPAEGAGDADVRARLQALGYVGSRSTSLARQNLGEVLYRAGKLDAAERELRAVVAGQPDNLNAWLWLAKTVAAQGRPAEALSCYARAMALPGAPGDAVIEAAALAAEAGLIEEGRRMMARAPRLSLSARRTAQGVLLWREGHAAAAETELRAALAADPGNAAALTWLLDVLAARRRVPQGLSLIRSVAAQAPASPRHQAVLGEALLASGKAVEAEAALARALALAPDSAALRLDLARARVAQRKLESARAALEPAPSSRDRSVLLGVIASLEERWDEAARHYEAALATARPTTDLLNGLAWAQLRLGRKPEAIGHLRQSLVLDANQPAIRALLTEAESAPVGPAR